MKAGLLKFSLLLAIALVVPSCQLPTAQGAKAIAAVEPHLLVDGIVELY